VNPNNYMMYSISLKCMFLANIKVFVYMLLDCQETLVLHRNDEPARYVVN